MIEYLIIFIIFAVMLGASAAILTRAGERDELCKYDKNDEDTKNDNN